MPLIRPMACEVQKTLSFSYVFITFLNQYMIGPPECRLPGARSPTCMTIRLARASLTAVHSTEFPLIHCPSTHPWHSHACQLECLPDFQIACHTTPTCMSVPARISPPDDCPFASQTPAILSSCSYNYFFINISVADKLSKFIKRL